MVDALAAVDDEDLCGFGDCRRFVARIAKTESTAEAVLKIAEGISRAQDACLLGVAEEEAAAILGGGVEGFAGFEQIGIDGGGKHEVIGEDVVG